MAHLHEAEVLEEALVKKWHLSWAFKDVLKVSRWTRR